MLPALLLTGCGAVDAWQIDETWFACSRDRECQVVQDPTCSLTPINRRYSDSLARWMALHHPDEVNPACLPPRTRYFGECEDSRCSSSITRR